MAAMLLALGCGGATGPGAPASVEATTATSIAGVVATSVVPVPTVVVRDASGHPVTGVLVRWRVVSGGGQVATAETRTGSGGAASSGGWVLGNVVGTQELVAEVDGAGTVRFFANVSAGAVTRLVRVSPDPQSGVVGQPVAAPPSVRAEDALGNPVPGVTITFTVVSGGGTVAGSTKVTNASGIATLDAWTLGPTLGQQLVRATGDGGAAVVFTANAQADVPAAIQIVSGNNQSGFSAVALPVPLVVRVVDRFGNPVSGVPLTVTPASGSGVVQPVVPVTNENGLATFTWTLGFAATQTLVVSVTSNPSLSVTFTATVIVADFRIIVRYVDFTPNARQQLAIDRAVVKFRSIITGTTGTSQVTLPAARCGRDWMPAVNETITDLVIYARIGFIDGTPTTGNNIIGNANVCVLHPSSRLPALGTLLLDSDDLTALEGSGLVDPLVLHEMGHTLGIGTLWDPFVVGTASDPFFTGPNANARFLAVGGGAYSGNKVPVEAGVGSGSDRSHWRESVLGREIMTSSLSSGVNPLSVVTIGSMQDIGYSVSYANADPYTFTAASATITGAPISIFLGNDVLPMPPLPAGAVVRDAAPGPRRSTTVPPPSSLYRPAPRGTRR